jgi:methylmalonyl-CoA mutase
MAQSQRIYDAFEPANFEAWKQRVIKEVKGEEAFDALYKTTNEGVSLKPYYTIDDLNKEIPAIEVSGGWHIQERIPVKNADEALKAAYNALKKGAEEIVFEIESEAADTVLSQIDPFTFRLSQNAKAVAGNFQADILSSLINTESFSADEFEKLVKKHSGTLEVNGATYYNAGANVCTEIAISLAHGNEYLNIGTNVPVLFNMAIGSDYFFEIAKLRALRKLWSVIAIEHDVDTTVTINCDTALNNKTIYDYNNNILRASTETMAAVIGGCDGLYVHPYDVLFKQPNDFSNRIARNIQLIAKKESYLDKVNDAAHGSYYIENLSNEIASKSWELFQNIEAKGGYIACLDSGFLQDTIAKQAETTQQQVDNANRVILGVNKYPNNNEKMKEEIEEVELPNNKHFPLHRWTEKAEKERLKNE